jgi:hypothetical protein
MAAQLRRFELKRRYDTLGHAANCFMTFATELATAIGLVGPVRLLITETGRYPLKHMVRKSAPVKNTGGGGFDFADKVAARFLVDMLSRGFPFEVKAGSFDNVIPIEDGEPFLLS